MRTYLEARNKLRELRELQVPEPVTGGTWVYCPVGYAPPLHCARSRTAAGYRRHWRRVHGLQPDMAGTGGVMARGYDSTDEMEAFARASLPGYVPAPTWAETENARLIERINERLKRRLGG